MNLRSSVPPAAPDLSAIKRQFEQASTTLSESEGARTHWHKGRGRYAVWVVRVACEQTKRRVHSVGAVLQPWIVAQSLSDLHVTLGIAGFPVATPRWPDDVEESVLRQQAAVCERMSEGISFHVHGACSFLSAPFLGVSDDHGALGRYREVLDPPGRPVSIDTYVPHITIGRWNGAHAIAPLAVVLQNFAHMDAIYVKATAIELVHFDAHDPLSSLQTRMSISL